MNLESRFKHLRPTQMATFEQELHPAPFVTGSQDCAGKIGIFGKYVFKLHAYCHLTTCHLLYELRISLSYQNKGSDPGF